MERTVYNSVFVAAVVVGASYLVAILLGLGGPAAIVWKGAGVALLALWCAANARSGDGWLIAAVMAFGALGDVLIEVFGLTAGAAGFLAGHGLAIVLYVRNRRAAPTASQQGAAVALALGAPLVAWLLTGNAGVALYAVALGIMAATAWLSRFPRYRTGVGAIMFVASDLAIFHGLTGPSVLNVTIWPLYFVGQALIAWGVAQTLRTGDR